MSRRLVPHSSERGATLLTVLFIVFLMSAAALATTQAVTGMIASVRSTHGSQEASWLALAAAETAASALEQFRAQSADGVPPDADIALPSGKAQVHFADATNCFNINALVAAGASEPDAGALAANEDAFRRLLTAAGLTGTDAEALTRQTAAWIAAQKRDPAARGSWPGFRSPGELGAIEGFEPDVRLRLAPLLCARQPGLAGPVNINTLTRDELPVLAALLSDGAETGPLAGMIELRPAGGWLTVDEFILGLTERGIGMPEASASLLRMAPQAFRARVLIEAAGRKMIVETELQPYADGRVRASQPRWEVLQ